MALFGRQPDQNAGRRVADRQRQTNRFERVQQHAGPFAARTQLSQGPAIFLLHVQPADRPEQNVVQVEKIGLARTDRQPDTRSEWFLRARDRINNQRSHSQLASDEFEEATMIEVLELSNNCIKHLNRSLLPLTQLSEINLSFNKMTEFSFAEIKGLKELKLVDLSHNAISKLSGHSEVHTWNHGITFRIRFSLRII